jgi:lipid-binding SYLF domain-containing protein
MQVLKKIRRAASKAVSGVKQELQVLDTVQPEAQAALRRMEKRDPGLKAFLKRSHAYVVFPSVGKAAAVVGGAFGKGVVFQAGELVGYAGIVQMTVGVELGGGTFSQIVAFENAQSFGRFKRSPLRLAANASAVMVKGGAAASADYEKGAAVFVHGQGGLMLEAAVGGQKFVFKPAVLGRGKKVRHVRSKSGPAGPGRGGARGAAKSRN